MNRESIQPKDREHWLSLRSSDLTSTTIPALFNLPSRITAFHLWHLLRNNMTVEDVDNTAMRWGRRLEPVIAHGIAEDEGWNVRQKTEYMRLPDFRVGSSFDYETDAPALLEIKSVSGRAFRQGYVETDFGLEAPPAVEMQAQVEMLVSGLDVCYIGALVDNFTVYLLRREKDDVIHQRILDAAARFWARTEPPEPDYTRDADTIARLHGYSSVGKVIEADQATVDLMAEYRIAMLDEQAALARKEEAKARILMRIGDAERVESEVYTLSAKTVGAKEIATHTRKGYRGFKLNERGGK